MSFTPLRTGGGSGFDLIALNLQDKFFNFTFAAAAAAAGLAVIGYLIDGGQVIFTNDADDFIFGNTEAGADDTAGKLML